MAITGGPDSFGYTYSDSASGGVTYNFENISGTGTVLNSVSNSQDAKEVIPIGFAFTYYGNTYTNSVVATHGHIGFNNFGGSDLIQFNNTPLPTAADANELIAGWWDDLNPGVGGTVYYQTLGEAPFRRLIVQYDGVTLSGQPGQSVTFQIKLFESSNRIEIHYSSVPGTGNATIGIENASGTVGLTYFLGAGLPPLGAGSFAVVFEIPPRIVANTNNTGAGSLRQTIVDTPSGGRVRFNPALAGQTISLTSGELVIGKNITIEGGGLSSGVTLSANGSFRVINITANNTVTLDELTIANGGGGGGGAGIFNQGSLRLARSSLIGNHGTSGSWGGGILNTGTLLATNCTLANNSAEYGGGFFNEGNTSSAVLSHLTITNNTAVTGGGGVWLNFGQVAIQNSIIAENAAAGGPDLAIAAATYTPSGLILQGANAQLAPLAYYGGATLTRPPLAGSPAFNTATGSSTASDQRGISRPQGAAADVGAVESNFALTVSTVADSGAGSLREAIATAIPGATISFNVGLGSRTVDLSGGTLVVSRDIALNAANLEGGLILSGVNLHRVMSISAGCTVSLTGLTIANGFSGGNNGAGISNSGTLVLSRCTFTRNANEAFGGGLFTAAAGISTVRNCTFANNSASLGGGLYFILGSQGTVEHCTVAGNSALGNAGGIRTASATLTVRNSIVAANFSPPGTSPDIQGSGYTADGINFVGDLIGSSLTPGPTVLTGDPKLAPLANYGGPTAAMPPRATSAAINPAGGASSSALTTDQRGYLRVVGGIVDIGAVEAGPVITVTNTNDSGAGSLRQAIASSTTPGQRILFAPALAGSTITLSSGQIALTVNFVLSVDASNLSSGVTISGNNNSHHFTVQNGCSLLLDSLVLTGGQSASESGSIFNLETLVLNHCTLTGNSTGGGGGAVVSFGDTWINASTICNNNAGTAGGGIVAANDRIEITESTISGNTAPNGGGGVYLFNTTISFRNSIVAGNNGSPSPDIYKINASNITQRGLNLIGINDSVAPEFPAGPLVGTSAAPKDALLRPLALNGGLTPTMALRPGSPAIDASITTLGVEPTDQRGRPRITDGDGNSTNLPDLGAYEVGISVVTSIADSGAGTLRAALAANHGHEWIRFNGSVFNGTPAADIILSSQLVVGSTQDLHFIASNLLGGVTLNGNGTTRPLQIFPGGTLDLDCITITNGATPADGGGVLNSGSLTARRCTFSRNVATQFGGAIAGTGANCQLTSCTIADNRAGGLGGGGIDSFNGNLTLTSCTVSGNASGAGGGIWTTGTCTLNNCLVAGNSGPVVNDINGVVGGLGGNLIGDGSGMSGIVHGQLGNQVGSGTSPIDPKLAPLGRYGGPLETMALLAGSPALNTGNLNASIPVSDQRGFSWVGQPDVGALEAGPMLLVTNTNDSGSGSLRQQLAAATAPGTRILFSLPSSNSTIFLTNGELVVNASRTVMVDASSLVNAAGQPASEPDPLHPGSTVVPRGIVIDAGFISRIWNVSTGSSLALQRIAISSGGTGANGGGIVNEGNLVMVDSSISDCFTSYRGGGLSNSSHAALIRCTVSGNVANDLAGGIENVNYLTLDGSTVSSNTAAAGGGIFNFNRMQVRQSTVIANIASGTGGGIQTQNSVVHFENSIVAANICSNASVADFAAGGTNTLLTGGGNFIGSNGSFASVFPAGAPNANGDFAGTPGSRIDPMLGALAKHGGPTQVHVPLSNSPVVDRGDASGVVAFTDQRGFARSLAAGPDIGAVETAAGNFNADGLTLYARVPTLIATGGPMRFQISTDPDFFATVATIAGDGTVGTVTGAALSSQFSYPSDVTEDGSGARFIADSGNNRICMLTQDREVITIAGTGSFGLVDGIGSEARFSFPSGIAVAPDGNLYVADTLNHCIRKLTRPELPGLPWIVSTVAGDHTAGFADGIGTAARLNHPHAITLDRAGNLYVADTGNHRIRKITPDGVVSTYAGTGVAGIAEGHRLVAKFSGPFGVAIDVSGIAEGQAGGVLYVADTGNHRIRRIAPSDEVATIAGSSSNGFLNGPGTAARLNGPSGVAVDREGNVYVADRGNHAIRKLTNPAGADPWEVSTMGGTGEAGFADGRADSSGAKFNTPTGLHVSASGAVLVADHLNHRLRLLADPLSLDAALVVSDRFGSLFGAVIDAANLGLVPETTYYVRWVTPDGNTQPLGESFTLVPIPTVTTLPATAITREAADVNGLVDPNGYTTSVSWDYSTDPNLLGPLMVTTMADSLSDPRGIVINAAGHAFVAVREAHVILRVLPSGEPELFAGNGLPGSADGNGFNARFDHPVGIAMDGAGNLYVTEELGHRVRRITPSGQVVTIAGSGVAGFADDPLALAGKFLFPSGIAVTPDGSKIYVADRGNHRIRLISGGSLSTLAGDGLAGFADGQAAQARFQNPTGVAVDGSGNVFVADRDNHRIRVVNASDEVLTFAGSGEAGFLDELGTAARFSSPNDLAIDAGGRLHVADRDNHRLRVIAPDGTVTTPAGSGTDEVLDSPDDSSMLWPATATCFSGPQHVAVQAGTGVVVLTEAGSERIRRIERGTLPSVTLPQTFSSNGDLELGIPIPHTLLADTTYYFRVRATNPQGTSLGKILSFTTAAEPEIGVFAVIDPETALRHTQSEVINFGGTPLGLPVTREFMITNSGGWPLTVSAIVAPTGFSTALFLGSVPPGGSASFPVTLEATSGGTFSGQLEIFSDDPSQSAFSFPITGVVFAPPLVTTQAASGVQSTSATLNATVNPADSETTVFFEYGTDPQFEGVNVSTVAGGINGYQEGNGPAARFNQPRGLATDAAGNIYVADAMNHRIRRIAPDGTSTTIAGTGVPGFADGPAATAQFKEPGGLVRGSDGTLFVADTGNHRIRAITPGGEVSTYSGLGTAGFTNGVATAARFNFPQDLAMDPSGIIYVADSLNNRVRKIAMDGSVTTLAGSGTAGYQDGAGDIARFNQPRGIAVSTTGIVYLCEFWSHAIRRIQPDGTVSTLAGLANGSGFVNATGTAARFLWPADLALNSAGQLIVADSGNFRIRRVDAGGAVTTLAGSGVEGSDDGTGDLAQFDEPISVASGPDGSLVVGETNNSAIRLITPTRVLVEAASGLNGNAAIPVSVQASDLLPGVTYYFRALATNSGGTTFGATLSTGGSPFLLWQTEEFGPDAGNPLIAGELANPSGDGIPNLLKYALNLDPHTPTANGLPAGEVGPGTLTLTYTRVKGASDLDYVIEWSTDLGSWSASGVSEEILSQDAITELVKASVARGTDRRKFIRLNVSLQQP